MFFTTQIQKIVSVFLKKSGNFRAAAKNLGVSTHSLFRWNDGTLLYGIEPLTLLTKLGVQVLDKRSYSARLLQKGQTISDYTSTRERVAHFLCNTLEKYKYNYCIRAYLDLRIEVIKSWVSDKDNISCGILFDKLDEMGFCLDIFEDEIIEILELIKNSSDVELMRAKGKLIEEENQRLQSVLHEKRKEEQQKRADLAEQHRQGKKRIKKDRTPEIDPNHPRRAITVDLSLPRGFLPFDAAAVKRVLAGSSIAEATYIELPPEKKPEIVISDIDLIPPSVLQYVKLSQRGDFSYKELNRKEVFNLADWQERALEQGLEIPPQGFSNKEIQEVTGDLFSQEEIESYYSTTYAVLDHEYINSCFNKEFLEHFGAVLQNLHEKNREIEELKNQLAEKLNGEHTPNGEPTPNGEEEIQSLRRQNKELASTVQVLTGFLQSHMGIYKDFQDAPLEIFEIVKALEKKQVVESVDDTTTNDSD